MSRKSATSSSSSYEESENSEEDETKIPPSKIADEPFKLLFCQRKLKQSFRSKYKTDSSLIFSLYNKRKNEGIPLDCENPLKKITKCYTTHKFQKIYFVSSTGETFFFNLMKEKKSELIDSCADKLTELDFDFDTSSDEEEIKLGTERALKDLKRGFEMKNPYKFLSKEIKHKKQRRRKGIHW